MLYSDLCFFSYLLNSSVSPKTMHVIDSDVLLIIINVEML